MKSAEFAKNWVILK